MSLVIGNIFNIGDIVYLKTDIEQLPRMVYCMGVYCNAECLYDLICGTTTSAHYSFEISTEKTFHVNA